MSSKLYDDEHSYAPHFIPMHPVKQWKEKKKISTKKYHRKLPNMHTDESLHKFNITLPVIKMSKNLKKEQLILPLRQFITRRENNLRKSLKQIPLKDKYKVRASDLYIRIFTEEPKNDTCTILDIDRKFFSMADGRPLAHRTPLYKTIKELYSKTFMLTQEAGFRKDTVLCIEINNRIEQVQLNASNEMVLTQVKYFEQFVSEDYSKSMSMLKEWENIRFRLHLQNVKYRNLAAESYSIRSRIISFNDRYTLQKKYQRFLSFLSPEPWIIQNKITNYDFGSCDIGTDDSDDSFSIIFDKMRKELSQETQAPILFFNLPDDIMRVYRSLEKQNYIYFQYVTQASTVATQLNEMVRSFQAVINYEYKVVEDVINHFNQMIDYSTSRAQYLREKFFYVLNGSFYEIVASSDILTLSTSLGYCYRRVLGESPCNMSVYAMTQYLEDYYLKYIMQLDILSNNAIRTAIEDNFKTDLRTMKKAVQATREIRLLDRLSKRLQKAAEQHAASRKHNYFSSRVQSVKPKARNKSVPPPLTEAQMEYLTLFTEWTAQEDPTSYLQSKETEELMNL